MHKRAIIRNLIIIFFIIIFILLIIWFVQEKYFHKINNDVSSITVISRQNNLIHISDNYPMDDKIGKNISFNKQNSKVQGYYEFEVKSLSNVGSNFEIYAVEEDVEKKLHPNFIKIYLTDENDKPLTGYDNLSVPTYYNLKVSDITPAGRRLYYGYIGAHESKKYKLRVWVGDAYALSTTSKEYGMKIYVEAD